MTIVLPKIFRGCYVTTIQNYQSIDMYRNHLFVHRLTFKWLIMLLFEIWCDFVQNQPYIIQFGSSYSNGTNVKFKCTLIGGSLESPYWLLLALTSKFWEAGSCPDHITLRCYQRQRQIQDFSEIEAPTSKVETRTVILNNFSHKLHENEKKTWPSGEGTPLVLPWIRQWVGTSGHEWAIAAAVKLSQH